MVTHNQGKRRGDGRGSPTGWREGRLRAGEVAVIMHCLDLGRSAAKGLLQAFAIDRAPAGSPTWHWRPTSSA